MPRSANSPALRQATNRPGATSAQLRAFRSRQSRGGVAAARMERAARRRIGRVGDLALEDDAVLGRARHRRRRGRQQRLGVGMQRRARRAPRSRPPRRCAPRYITATRSLTCSHHRQIVRDEQVGQPEPLLQVEQQVQDLRLDRDVERRDRLVGHDELGVQRQRAGDADALALAAGELVRDSGRWSTARSPTSSSSSPRAPAALGAVAHAVDQQRLADDVADRHARVERGVGVLEDHLHVPAQRPQRRAGAGWPGRRALARWKWTLPAGRLERAQDAARRRWSCRSRIRRPAPASRRGGC